MNIPHNSLKNNIRSLVREAFKIRGAKYTIVDRHGNGHWSLESASSTACVSVRKSKLVEWTEYLIGNVYIKVGNNVYVSSNHRHTYGNRLCTSVGKLVPISLRIFVHEKPDA